VFTKDKQLVISKFCLKNLPKMACNIITVAKKHNEKICSFCGSKLELQEGVMVYDRNWFHSKCWLSYEKKGSISS
jgi:hypothetical protein